MIPTSRSKIDLNKNFIKINYLNSKMNLYLNSVINSLKIHFIFIRFISISMVSAMIDLGLFSLLFFTSQNIFLAMIGARIFSGYINFRLNEQVAFKAEKDKIISIIKYFLLAISLLGCSYIFVRIMCMFHFNVYLSKIFSEIILFLLSFIVQNFFIFNRP